MDIREAELIFEVGREAVVKAILDMDARIVSLSQEVIALQQKIASLTTNSTNSSKPPSTDGPRVGRPKKTKSPRSAGGQKGHPGHKRQLLPVEQMDHVHDRYPKFCEKCAAPLEANPCAETSEPFRYQTFEYPEVSQS